MLMISKKVIKGTTMIIDLKFSCNEFSLFENLNINSHQIVIINYKIMME